MSGPAAGDAFYAELACVAAAHDAGYDLESATPWRRDMIDGAVTALDSVELRRPASRKSEDEGRPRTRKAQSSTPPSRDT